MTELARTLRKNKTYDQIKSDVTFRKWMLSGLRDRNAQVWILNFWLDTYWKPRLRSERG
ncbi:hypothetical protein HB780_02935 (plasmid) [Rhizobium lusitanum]|uniref:hypothetical protein n=1 Tax=Rhizobium lusitanum TaxID=293958 RepID=UPI00160B5D15|nr:hypothetical protein [Rhizobium lusitanum]QND44754.1 hypothetical protein HB780_02935 [Rhizobium lusitanum]